MKKVIVTAANCFIGRHLCFELNRKGYKIYAVVREGFSNNNLFHGMDNVNIIQCNMENYSYLHEKIHEECDIGIALAWDGTRGESRNDKYRQRKNIAYSMESINEFIKLGCSVIMTSGSQAEYGPLMSENKVTEEMECNPNTEYGKAKVEFYYQALKLCLKNNVRFIEPRFFSLYGSDDFSGTMLVSMTKNMLYNKPCNLTECKQLWDFLYIDDAVTALVKLLENHDCSGVYNFGSGVSKELKVYVEEMHESIHSISILNYGAVPYPSTGIVHTNPDVSKLMNDVDWRPKITFLEGIQRMVDYIRERENEKN